MNDQALKDSYQQFTDTGYSGSLEDFKTLLSSNEDARNDAHKLFSSSGYDGSIEDFGTLVGINAPKKKDSTDLSSDDSAWDSLSIDTEPVGFAQGSGEINEGTVDAQRNQAAEGDITVNKGRKTQALGQALGEMAKEEEDAVGRWARYQDGLDADAPSTQSTTNLSPFAATLARTDENATENEIKDANTVADVRAAVRKSNADKVNVAYDDAMSDNDKATNTDSEFTEDGKKTKGGLIETDEEGNTIFNEKNLGLTLMDMDAVATKEAASVAREAARVEGSSVLGLVAHDMATGIMDITNSVQGVYDREGAQDDMYENTFRTQASYKEYGLTEEEIGKGVSENLAEGNISAASKVFAVQAAQTVPQLLSQVAIAYATGGLGASASASMWASSGFMGATTFGRTWADTYGQMDNSKAFMLALGDAAAETLSERLFTSDVKALSGVGAVAGKTRNEIKDMLFAKGLLSKEFGNFGITAVKGAVMGGAEEGLEEIIATVGSGIVHAAVNDEEINLYEVMDSAIIGFGMGMGSNVAGAAFKGKGLLTAGVSALGYGGLRSELVKIKSNKTALAKELTETSDAARKEVLIGKIKALEGLEMQIAKDTEAAYDSYSDSDAKTTIEANQKLSNILYKLRNNTNNLTKEEKISLTKQAQEQFGIINSVEAKYEGEVAAIKTQQAENTEFLNGMESSVEVSETTELPDTPLMRGIKNVAKALANKGTKVFIHRNLDDAAEVSGADKLDLAGSNGFYKAEDGTIHIMASLAQNNTAYHEGFHDILRDVSPDYAKRFVDAALRGMDSDTAAKYKAIYASNMKSGGQKLAVEEVFAEIQADIAVGAISETGAGTSVVRAAMESVKKSLNALGIPVKPTASFKEFVNFVGSVNKDFTTGTTATASKGKFGSNEITTENFMQMSAKAVDALKTATEAQFTVAKGKKLNGSFINSNTTFTNLAEVVETFKKENGRAPKVLFWMGDQSARGAYATSDGTNIDLEGGISFSQDPANTDNGVVWATNKNNNEVQGLVKDADIVAIVSGKPETGHRFYKGTSVVIGTELMEAFNRNKGQSIEYPQRGGAFNFEIPTEGFTDPLQAMQFFYATLSEKGLDFVAAQEFIENSKGFATQAEYLAQSKGDRMGALNYFLEPSITADAFFSNLGMKPMADVQTEMRDGYLVENEFTTGDIYAFYQFTRDADGKVETADGKHSTYSTDIKGKALGIANRRDNIYQVADLGASTTSENKLSGSSKLELLKEEGYVTQAQIDEVNSLEEAEQGKAKNALIRTASVEVKKDGNELLTSRLTNKGGYISAETAGDKSLKRIVSDAGTAYDGQTLLDSLIAGQTADGRQEALNKAAAELVAEGKAKEVEFKKGKNKFTESSLPVGLVLERAARNEDVSFDSMATSVNAETKRKASILHQATIIIEIAERILLGEKKAAIVASLRAKGMSSADANLVYAKSAQYAKGAKKGWTEGTRERSAQHAAKRKAERKQESAKAKDFRKKAAAILNQEKKTGDVILREIANLIKEAGVEIKASQVATLIRIAKKVARVKGRSVLGTEARYELLNSITDKVVKIIDKQITAKELDEYTNRLRKVESEQKKLRDRLTKLKNNSRSPLISYADQILDMTSLNAAMLSPESLILLEASIKDLQISTKSVSVTGQKLGKPYIFVEGLGNVDARRAKLYFNEIYENLKVEEVALQEKTLVEKATDLAFENDTDWVAEYNGLIKQISEKDLKGVQKKLADIAEDLGLDLNDINDFAIAEKIYSEEKTEKLNSQKDVIVNDAILPTYMNFRRLFESNESLAAIFGVPTDVDDATAAEIVKGRMEKLTALELKRLEFGMYDFAVNGKALGMSQLAAVITAKNDNNPKLAKLGLKSREKEGAGKGVYSRFENTPSYFRRLFLASEAKIAQFMDIVGFSELRSAVALADSIANTMEEVLIERAKELGVASLSSQVKIQILSVLSQIPSGKNTTQHLAQVVASLELAYLSDKRFDEDMKAEVRAALDEVLYDGGKGKNYDDIIASFVGTNELLMLQELRGQFGVQAVMTKTYAEEYLGMNFKEEENYMPIRMRAVGSNNNDITRLQENIENIQQAYRSYGSAQQKQASSTYERNAEAMGSKTRYIDLNFYDGAAKTFRENEVKARTASSIAKLSTMTSEANEEFKAVVTEPEQRQKVRKKVMLFLTENAQVIEQQDELIGTSLKKFSKELNNLTVLYFFGSAVIQVFKQSSAIANTIIEGGNFFTVMGYVMTAATGKYSSGQKAVMQKSDIGGRDYIKETVSATVKGNAMTENGKWSRMRGKAFDLSTLGLRQADKVAATASWLAYFEQYQRKENGFTGQVNDEQWRAWSVDYDGAAADYATLMVTKDQNISTSRDKSEFRNMNSGQVAQFIQMIVMPFANFLINKKLNLMLDFQKLGKGETRVEAIKSIGGTALEVAAFHGVSQFVIAPMIQALVAAIGGGEEEEEDSWFDTEFRWGLFKKGMLSDLNPLVMPVGAMESWATTAYNMIDFMATDEAREYEFEDRSWWENFQAWETVNGMPKFNGAGRGDMNWITALKGGGVYGDVTVELALSALNLKTLAEDNPYYVTTFGTKKYLSSKDAKSMMKLEGAKLSMMTIGGFTGLFSKEAMAAIKGRERQVGKRGITNENEAIGRMIINEGKGTDLMTDKIVQKAKSNPLAVESTVRAIVGDKVVKSVTADKLPSPKYINTIRDIAVKTQDPRDAALAAKVVMMSMSPAEAAEFKSDFLKYIVLKQGENAVANIAMILN